MARYLPLVRTNDPASLPDTLQPGQWIDYSGALVWPGTRHGLDCMGRGGPSILRHLRPRRKVRPMTRPGWSAESVRLADAMTRWTLGTGVPAGGYSPARGLANALQRMSPDELAWEAPLGQWEAMLSAMPA